jgi:hypothetical protein
MDAQPQNISHRNDAGEEAELAAIKKTVDE